MKARSVLVFFLFFVSIEATVAQDLALLLNLSESSLTINNGEIRSVTIRLENKTNSDFSGRLRVSSGDDLSILSKESEEIQLGAGSSRFISVQIFADNNTKAGQKQISFELFNSNSLSLKTHALIVNVPVVKLVSTKILNTLTFIPEIGAELEIPIRILNRGNTDQKVKVIASFPALGNNDSYDMFLSSQSDTIINIKNKVTPAITRMEELKINIIGMYENGDFFSSQSLMLYSPRSTLRYHLDNRINNQSQNFLTVGVIDMFSVNQSEYLRGHISTQRGETKTAINFDVINWPNNFSVQNTWLEFEQRKFGARLGNINKYGDLNFYGRGGELSFSNVWSGYDLSGGYLSKVYDLFNKNGFDLGNAAWISARRFEEKFNHTITLAKDKDVNYHSDNQLMINAAEMGVNKHLRIGAKLGIGNSTDIQNSDESHKSLMVEASVDSRIDSRFSIHSTNSYSSGYFPGPKRGTINLSQRFIYQLSKQSISANYRFYRFDPQYHQSVPFHTAKTVNHYANIGVAGNLGTWNYNLGPYYTSENGSWNWMNLGEIKTLESATFNGNVNWRHFVSSLSINMQVDAGRSWIRRENVGDWQIRGSLNFNYKDFRLMSTVQKGMFYLYEAYRKNAGERLFRFQLAPSYNKSFFNNTLQLNMGVMYIVDDRASNYLYTSRISYRANNTHFFVNAQLNKYGNYALYQNFQVGITQDLPSFTRTSQERLGRLDLFIFNDENGNGQYDEGDSIAAGYVLYIDGKPFLTDKNGRVVYKKLPPKMYSLDAPARDGWFLQRQSLDLQPKQHLSVNVPLQRSGRISGKVDYQEGNILLEYSVNRVINNLKVIAEGEGGNRNESRTDDRGRFIMFLPPGGYSLSIEGLPENVESINDGQEIEVTSDEAVEGLIFLFKVKEQKIEIKRFSD